MTKNVAKLLINYSEKWVALSKDNTKILAAGKDMKEVITKLGKHNPEEVILTWIDSVSYSMKFIFQVVLTEFDQDYSVLAN